MGKEPLDLQPQVVAALKAMSPEELYNLVIDKAAFEAFLHRWLERTTMGERYVASKKRVAELAHENVELYEELQNVDQQASAAHEAELRTAQADYNKLRERQEAVLKKIDISRLIGEMRRGVQSLDKGDGEREALERLGDDGNVRDRANVKALVDTLRQKREAYHAADIRATAAEKLKS